MGDVVGKSREEVRVGLMLEGGICDLAVLMLRKDANWLGWRLRRRRGCPNVGRGAGKKEGRSALEIVSGVEPDPFVLILDGSRERARHDDFSITRACRAE